MRIALRRSAVAAALTLALTLTACASHPPPPVGAAPKFPGFPKPDIPAALNATTDLRAAHDLAWRRLQAGDSGGANRDFSAVLKRRPDFYPSTAGLGFVSLAGRQFKAAATRFAAVLERDDRYLPAWLGKAEAELGLGNDIAAIAALERILVLDPKREGVSARLELLRFRQVQSLIDSGRKARAAGRLDEAEKVYETALSLSPSTTLILAELSELEVKRGALEEAETHARRLVQLEPNDADGLVVLSAILEARQKYGEAAAMLTKAVALDPRPEWRTKANELRTKASMAAIPAELRDTASRATVTRAEVASYIGLNLGELIQAVPPRAVAVATDVRNHWATPWILPVTRAGVMEVYPNHTFQPGATVRRNDLAQIVAALVALPGASKPADLTRWRAARPRFTDLPATNVVYRAAALAVSSGALSADADGRFQPTRPATGAELAAAISRLGELSLR